MVICEMKSYTDIQQSKKLTEFLPIESADMCYIQELLGGGKNGDYKPYIGDLIPAYGQGKIPCWSLAALLALLPASVDDGQHCLALINSNPNGDTEWLCCYEDCNGNLLNECYADNPVDACYDMIITLHEKKRLI